jgi:3-isopropylmalate/(R)-2-methylmalate dehydratase small subunit
MNPIREIAGRSVALPVPNIDTDRIIPARFLTTTQRAGLGAHAFHDWRFRSDGTPDPEFALNRPEAAGATILLAGHNFGCGSSREHAPWALLDLGLRAVLAPRIADIFRNNALKNGLLALEIDEAAHARLLERAGEVLRLDVEAGTVTAPDGGVARFNLDPFVRRCLLDGVDELGYLLQRQAAIAAYEETRRCAA